MNVSTVAVVGSLVLGVGLASAQGVTDAQIAAIVVTANQVDIDAGTLAHARSQNDAIKTFAQLMVTSHAAVNTSAVDLVNRLKLTPADNATSRSLKAAGDRNLAHLETLTDVAFDKAYIDHEVAYHQQVLDTLDQVLIPGATNAELKALLVKVRPAFAAHLKHAKHLQTSTTRSASRASGR